MPAPQTAAEKAARKKQRMAAKKLPAPPPPVRALRTLAVFDAVSAKVMEALEAKALPETLLRDAMLFEPGQATAADPFVHFIIAGQVGVGEHTEEAHKSIGKKAKAELFKKVGQTWAVFAAGDFWSDGFCAVAGDLCMYAITETQSIKIKESDIAEILKRHPAVRDRLKSHTEKWLHRIRYMKENGGREEIFDFYVKNGFSFSTRTKIRQLELCIDCDKCVVGCEERHGFARLERFGPQVGLINFSVSCRQCYDPRCLIDCNFDAIARDPISQEIRVDIASCTGCSVCARSCPNDSIFVYPVSEEQDTSLWTDAGKKVPKKVATKCDRCAGFDDMACIAACPTGSMIDATPEIIFGLETTKTIDNFSDTRPFEQGYGAQSTPRLLPKLLYGFAAVVTFLCTLEWLFRRWSGETFLLPVFTEEVMNSRLGEGYKAGQGFGFWLGIIGASCMVSTLVYVIRNRFEKETTYIGSKYFWFAFHNALGVLGPALVFLHGNLSFTNWSAIGVYASLFVVASGFLGQYLANQLPGREYANHKDRAELDRAINQLSKGWGEHTRAVDVNKLMAEAQKERDAQKVENMSAIRFIFFIILDDIRQLFRLLHLRFVQLPKSSKSRVQKRELYRAMRDKLNLERRDRFYKTAGRLVSQWRLFHIFFSIGLFLLMFVHVAWVVAL